MRCINKSSYYIISGLVLSTLLSGLILSSTFVSADDVVDEVNITVPVSCSMSGIGMDSHSATINNGTYNSAIGETTINAFCNDNEGFAIYAVGFTDDEPGKNVLTSSSLGSTYDIATGTAISGDNSNWAMKLSATSGTYTPIIAGSEADTEKESGDPDFTSFQAVPSKYAKVAYRTSGTDIGASAEGSTLTTTYQAYISPNQPAGTYAGQVKYTLVHPHDTNAPITNPAVLDTGKTVNAKLKSLAATVVNGEEVNVAYNEDDNYIKSISVHLETSTPVGFIPSEKNTVSSPTSEKPIYIIFNNTDDTGTMHFYTEGEKIFLPSDSSQMFFSIKALTDLSALSNWDSSNVIDASYLFSRAGYSAPTFSLDLSSWNTSSVTNMSEMFSNAGYSATNFSLDLSSWNTSSVTNMYNMFRHAGHSATAWSIDGLSSWNTANVTSMDGMFYYAGYNATTFSLNLSSWNTINVRSMNSMFTVAGGHSSSFSLNLSGWNITNVTSLHQTFYSAGYAATDFSLDLSGWNTANMTSMNSTFYNTGYNATSFSLDLSGWNTANVTSMRLMFYKAGQNATSFSLDLSSWNTANVTNMDNMFEYAGRSATTWSVTIPQANGGGINNTTSNLYGQTTSIYATPDSGKSFTLAQP